MGKPPSDGLLPSPQMDIRGFYTADANKGHLMGGGAGYIGPDGKLHRPPSTFDSKDDAIAWLAARRAEIQLNGDVTGYLRASEISRDRVEDARNVLKEGDEVNAMIINVDRKARSIQLSIKAKDNADAQEGMQRLQQSSERENAGTTSLGALLRAKLDK